MSASSAAPHLNLTDLAAYAAALSAFRDRYDLAEDMAPIDHLAIKLAGSEAYEACLASVRPLCRELTEAPLNGRRIATALLREGIALPGFGETSLLEIMEPRPERAGRDLVGIDHLEMVHPDLAVIERRLAEQGVPVSHGDNGHHRTVIAVINEAGQEIKFTDRPLKAVIQEEAAAGALRILIGPLAEKPVTEA